MVVKKYIFWERNQFLEFIQKIFFVFVYNGDRYCYENIEEISLWLTILWLCPNLLLETIFWFYSNVVTHIPKIAPFFHCFPMVSSYFRIVSKDFSPIREKADSLCLSLPLSIQTFFFCNLDFYSIQLILI